MPSLDTIRTLTIKATTDGVDDATKSLNDLSKAQANVSVTSDTTSKSTLSSASALDRLQKSLDPNYKATSQLQSAQSTLGKSFDQGLISVDKYNQLMGLATQRFDDAGKKITPFNTALTGVKTQIIGLAAGLGPVGETLAAFGPLGLAAGAGIALASAAFDKMTASADELAAKAQGLNTFATVTGLTIDQVQALTNTAAKFGLSSSDVSGFVDKFTAKLTELRTASGPLYDQILKIDSGIAQQMLTTKDTTAEIDLLAKAYKEAGADGNALLIAAGGRGGVVAAPVIGAIGDAGGLNALNDAMDKGSRLSDDLTKKLATLKATNDSLKDDIQNNIASLFSSSILQNQVQARSTVLDITTALKGFSLSGDWSKFVDDIKSIAAADIKKSVGGLFSGTENGPANPAGSVTKGPALPDLTAKEDPVATANKFKTYVSALGSAATASDQLKQKTLDLDASLAKGTIDQATYNKALEGATLDAVASKQSSYVSALGEFATSQDKATLASDNFRKSMLQNPRLTDAQRTSVVALTTANDEWTRANNQAQLGVFNLAEATKAAGDQFKAQQAPGGLLDKASPQQLADAFQAYTNKVIALGEAAKVAGSAFPQLTQLGLDAGNVNKQFDTFATTSLNGITPALTDMLNGTTSLSSGFQNLGLVAVKALEGMLIQMTLIKPLAQSLGLAGNSFLSFLGVSTGTVANGGITLGNASGPTAFIPSAHGNVFEGSNIIPFARGGVVDEPTLFKFASGTGLMGEAGPEAIVPLKRGSDGNLGIASSGGGGGSVAVNVQIQNHNNSDVSVSHQKNSSGGTDLTVMVRDAVNQNFATGQHDKVMASRFGARPQTRSR